MDGEWRLDSNAKTILDSTGIDNNYITASDLHSHSTLSHATETAGKVAKIVEKIESTPETIIPSPLLRAVSSIESLRKSTSIESLRKATSIESLRKAAVSIQTKPESIAEEVPTTDLLSAELGSHIETKPSSKNFNDTHDVPSSVESSIADLKSTDSTFVESEDEEQQLNETEAVSKDKKFDQSANSDSEWEQVSNRHFHFSHI